MIPRHALVALAVLLAFGTGLGAAADLDTQARDDDCMDCQPWMPVSVQPVSDLADGPGGLEAGTQARDGCMDCDPWRRA